MPLLSLAIFAGCNPMDAQVWGDYAIFLAAESSGNIDRLEAAGRDFANPDVRANHGITELFDCRDLSGLDEAEMAAERLDDEAGLDGQYDYEANCCRNDDVDLDPTTNDCNPYELNWHTWLDDQAYYTMDGQFAPGTDMYAWRTEALITAEGDLQLTVHIDFPKIGDLRYNWVIDPDFQPTDCVDGEEGSELVDVDGDWLAGWSSHEETSTIWYLNANSYQLSPSDYTPWYIEQDWMAGATDARFEDELFYGHSTDYDDGYESTEYPYGYPLYFWSYGGGGDATFPTASDYATWIDRIDEKLENYDELENYGNSTFDVEYKVEDNSWRVPYYERSESDTSGLYDWTGVNVSWVRIDNPDNIEVHSEVPVTGDFQIMLDGVASASKVFIKGQFVLSNIREDVWGYSPTLEGKKMEENNTPECGDYRLTWEDGEE